MKKAILTALSVLGILQCSACGQEAVFTVGAGIGAKDVTDFYYTDSNINYNASYQRYRFYAEDGGYFFYYETRERPGGYGPTTEEDMTAVGTIPLSQEEWETFFSYLKDGTVRKRTETADAGGCGPWMYLYWENDRSAYQAYSFASAQRRLEFEAYCAALARSAGGGPEHQE